MVKVKGQISEMATCLEDDDSRIAELAKSFFAELSKKVKFTLLYRNTLFLPFAFLCRVFHYVEISFQGNAVYNILPDVISRLSDPETGIQEAPFRNIMRYCIPMVMS
jgi:condensin complex subunit 1